MNQKIASTSRDVSSDEEHGPKSKADDIIVDQEIQELHKLPTPDTGIDSYIHHLFSNNYCIAYFRRFYHLVIFYIY